MPQTPTGSRKLIRELNRSVVLNMVKENGPIGRAEIARRSGLSPAAITSISADLMEEGWILETDTGESSGGRRPILMQINSQAGYVIGIKLAEHSMLGVITDLNGHIIEKEVVDTDGNDPQAIANKLAGLIESLCTASRIPRRLLLGVGVGLAGVVDADRGTSRHHPFLGWRDVPIGSLLQSLVKVPVYIDNDVNTLTYAERLFGRGRGVENFIVVTVGRGVGMGMVLNGQLYAGARGGSGEFGHTVMDENGPPCACGKNGCLETFVGEEALLLAAKQAYEKGDLPKADSFEALIDLGLEDEPAAKIIFERAGTVLGMGIANLINLFNPALILFGGEGVRAGDMLFDPMRVSAEQHTIPVLWPDTEIIIDSWGDDAWAVGAASLVLGEVFRSPVQKAVPNSSV